MISEFALRYAALGWKLVPCLPRDKRPRLGNDWQNKASSDPLIVQQWFSNWPDSNLGLLLGAASGVIDVEADDAEGQATASRLLHGCPTPTWDSQRGTHRLFAYAPDLPSGSAVIKAAGLEFRIGGNGKACQSMLPPSWHPGGKQLAWQPGRSPWDCSPLPVPDCLRELLAPPPTNGDFVFTVSDDDLAAAPGVSEGGRHKQLNILLGHYLDRHGNTPELLTLALGFAARCTPPLPEAEASRCVHDIVARHLRKTAAQPVLTPRPKLLAYQPFPVGLLPEPLSTFVNAVADSVGCDPAFAALPAIAACSATIGNSCVFTAKDDWPEPAAVWFGCVGLPGDKKSPAQSAAVRPIQEVQSLLMDEWGTKLIDHEAAKLMYEKQLAEWKKRKDDSVPPMMIEKPPQPRLWIDDTTTEAAALVLRDNPRGVLLPADELSQWLKSHNEYKSGKSGDTQRWCNIHGCRPIQIDRVSKSIYIKRPFVSICGGIQPAILRSFFKGEMTDSGLLQRFCLAWPPVRSGRKLNRQGIGEEAKRQFSELIAGLREFPYDDERQQVLQLSDDAWDLLDSWHDYTEAAREDASDVMRGVYSKLVAMAVRLSGIVHLVQMATGQVSRQPVISHMSMQRGVALSRWFADEWMRISELLTEAAATDADRRLVDYIRQKFAGRVAPHELAKAKRNIANAAEAEAILMRLSMAGWGMMEVTTSRTNQGRVFVLSADVAS